MKNLLLLRGNRKAQIGFMGIAFLSLVMMLAAFIIGCDKETPLGGDNQSQPRNPSDESAKTIEVQIAKFSYQGKLYEPEEFRRIFNNKEFQVTVAGMGSPDKDTVYVFETEVDFKAWTQTTPFAEKFAEMDKQIAQAGLQAKSQPSSETSLGKTSSAGGSAILYEHIDFLGSHYPIYPLPAGYGISNFGAFNDQASSLKVATCAGTTYCILFEHRDYNRYTKGAQIIFGYYSSSCYPNKGWNLTNYILRQSTTWNDQASSMIVL